MLIKKNSTVLFQGDSVTDAGRNYEDINNLGIGYPMMTSALFNSRYPELNVTFINRGISGNRAIDLRGRWEKDCICLKPDVVCILIGINDCWRRFDENNPTTPEEYKNNLKHILTEVKEKLDAQIIIMEPFLLSVTEEQKKYWREDLDPKIHVACELAIEFDALFIPLDDIFAAAALKREAEFWLGDGVHPTQTGHALIAENWIRAVSDIEDK